MAASVVPLAKITHVPLHCAIVEKPGRLCKILNEVNGWTLLAQKSENPDLSILYVKIARHVVDIVKARVMFFDPETGKSLGDNLVIAAYDQKGNLQGVAIVVYHRGKNAYAHIDFLISAIWNKMDLPEHQAIATKGVGTCLLNRIVELMPEKGPISLKASHVAVPFFLSRGFFKSNIFDHQDAPTTMKLVEEGFPMLARMSEGMLKSSFEAALPPTIEHFVDLVKKAGLYTQEYPEV